MSQMILFDDDCHFCQRSVQFIMKRDPKQTFKFASLQDNIGKQLLDKHQLPQDMSSLVLIKQDKSYLKSEAVLHICRNLKGLWKIGFLFLVIPRPLRDYIYDVIAKHRHRWFKTPKSCPLPTSEDLDRRL